jgi:hypothetical protein
LPCKRNLQSAYDRISLSQHVSIAVEFEKPIGQTIVYNGKKYSVCEPTPQRRDLPVGKQVASLKNQPYEIAYEYLPSNAMAGKFP